MARVALEILCTAEYSRHNPINLLSCGKSMSLTKDQIFYGDIQVRNDAQGFISLTDMWIASGTPDGKQNPYEWSRAPRAKKSGSSGKTSITGGPGHKFIEFIAKELNTGADRIYKTTRGKFGGTWAHWQIALAYAKYLSPEFHAWANQVVKDRIEEDHSPDIGITRSRERAIENWRKQGKSDEYIAARMKGIEVRNGFTGTLKDHNVSGAGYGICTNNIYQPILGGSAVDIRKERGLPQKANLRDNMSSVELGGVMFAEILAADKINREGRQGNGSCAAACLGAGMNIKSVIDKHESALDKPKELPVMSNTTISDRINNLRDKLR